MFLNLSLSPADIELLPAAALIKLKSFPLPMSSHETSFQPLLFSWTWNVPVYAVPVLFMLTLTLSSKASIVSGPYFLSHQLTTPGGGGSKIDFTHFSDFSFQERFQDLITHDSTISS